MKKIITFTISLSLSLSLSSKDFSKLSKNDLQKLDRLEKVLNHCEFIEKESPKKYRSIENFCRKSLFKYGYILGM